MTLILKLAHLIFEFEAEGDCSLPIFMGPMLRGAFGFALKRLVCVMRNRPCEGCSLEFACSYPTVFSPSPSPSFESERVYSKLPPPFVLRILSDGGKLESGQTLKFSLTLIGTAIASIPFVVRALVEASENGFGKDRAKFSLLTLVDREGVSWLDAQGCLLLRANSRQATKIEDKVALRFVSPLRLMHGGHLMTPDKFDATALVFASVKRASMLAQFHCDTSLGDVPLLKDAAAKVEALFADLKWQEEARYSSRQKTKLMVGGLIGEVQLNLSDAPEIKPFIGLLPEIGLGKATTMGLGAVDLLAADSIA